MGQACEGGDAESCGLLGALYAAGIGVVDASALMPHSLLILPLLVCLGQTSEPPQPEPAVQARLSFLASDADLDAPGSSTAWNVALEAHTPELASGLRAEAALSFFLSTEGTSQVVGFRDNGSAFRLRYRPSGWALREGVVFSVLPLSSTRMYLGFSYPVAWGQQAFPRRSSGEPGLELSLSRQRWSFFAATRSAVVIDDLKLEESRHYALLAGGSLEVAPGLRLELKGAYLNRGQAPGPAAQGIELSVDAKGGTLLALWQQGSPIGDSIDLSLHGGDPAFFERFFTPETYPGGLSASVSLEGSLVSQRLQDADAVAGQARNELAQAAALEAKLKQGSWRVHAQAYLRTPSFIQVDVPGLPPYRAFARDAGLRSEVSGTLGIDYFFQGWGVTPGLLARVALPAAYRGLEGSVLPGGELRNVVLRAPNVLSPLPVGTDRRPVLTVKATARWDLGPVAGMLAELFYVRDPNQTRFVEDETGLGDFALQPPNAVGVNLLLQARF